MNPAWRAAWTKRGAPGTGNRDSATSASVAKNHAATLAGHNVGHASGASDCCGTELSIAALVTSPFSFFSSAGKPRSVTSCRGDSGLELLLGDSSKDTCDSGSVMELCSWSMELCWSLGLSSLWVRWVESISPGTGGPRQSCHASLTEVPCISSGRQSQAKQDSRSSCSSCPVPSRENTGTRSVKPAS